MNLTTNGLPTEIGPGGSSCLASKNECFPAGPAEVKAEKMTSPSKRTSIY